MSVNSYKDLLIWQKGRVLVKDVYNLTNNFPKNEELVLTSQIRRSAISIPSNIAEGWAKKSSKDYVRFLNISLGSIAELETQLYLSEDLNYISAKENEKLQSKLAELGKMVNGLINSINNKKLIPVS